MRRRVDDQHRHRRYDYGSGQRAGKHYCGVHVASIEVKTLAAKIKEAQQPEIETMKAD